MAQSLSLNWGVRSFVLPLDYGNPEKNFSAALRLLVEQGLLKKGDTTVIAGAVLSGTQRVDAVQMRRVD